MQYLVKVNYFDESYYQQCKVRSGRFMMFQSMLVL